MLYIERALTVYTQEGSRGQVSILDELDEESWKQAETVAGAFEDNRIPIVWWMMMIVVGLR